MPSTNGKIGIRASTDYQHRLSQQEILVRVEYSLDHQVLVAAVPVDAVGELEREGLASPLPVLRGAALDAVVTVGMDAAALVTLLQAPDSIRAFAAWVRDRCARSGNSIELRVKRGDLLVHLTVRGHTNLDAVADFIAAALADQDSQP